MDFWDAFWGCCRRELATWPLMPKPAVLRAYRRRWGAVFRLYSEGLGYRLVATRLADLGVWTTRGSVERLIKGLLPPPFLKFVRTQP